MSSAGSAGKYILLIHASRYKGEFYNDVYAWSEATAIEVLAGQEVTGIDIGLAPQPLGAYQLTGRVISNAGNAIEGALVTLKNDDTAVAAVVTTEDGSYSIEGLPAHTYAITASMSGYTESTLSTPISLGSTLNIYGLNLTLTSKSTDVAVTTTQPSQFDLQQNYPNPFNPTTQISFSLAQSGNVRLTVYDLLGKEVKQLVHSELASGSHSVVWDGTNDRGEKAASGVYFYRLQVQTSTETFTKLRRMLLIK